MYNKIRQTVEKNKPAWMGRAYYRKFTGGCSGAGDQLHFDMEGIKMQQDNCITDGGKSQTETNGQEPERQKRGNEAARSYWRQVCALPEREREQQKPKPEPKLEPEPKPKPEAGEGTPTKGWEDFLIWEKITRDTIDFKKIYVDMAGDLVAGLLLSQIVFWNLPDRHGDYKLRVCKQGQYWIVKRREDWWDEIRLTPKQVDRALGLLREKGLVITARHLYNAHPTTHIRIDPDAFLAAWEEATKSAIRKFPISPKGEFPIYPLGKFPISPKGKLYNIDHDIDHSDVAPQSGPTEDGVESTPTGCLQGEKSEGAILADANAGRFPLKSKGETYDDLSWLNSEEEDDAAPKKEEKPWWAQSGALVSLGDVGLSAMDAVGRKYSQCEDEAEYNGLFEIWDRLQTGALPETFWQNRLHCAKKFGWSLDKLIAWTLDPEKLAAWQKRRRLQKKAEVEYDDTTT